MQNEKLIEVFLNLVEKKINLAEFEMLFYRDNDDFEQVMVRESNDEFDHNTFYDLLELDYTKDAAEAYFQVQAYLDHHSIESIPDERTVEEVESRLGYKLPALYIEYVKSNPGFYFETPRVLPINEPIPEDLKYYLGDGFWTINSIFRISLNESSESSILSAIDDAKEWGLPGDLIPIEGDGHTWIAFDYREVGSEPKVIFFETDQGQSLILAQSFEDFLKMLVPHSEVYDEDGNIIIL